MYSVFIPSCQNAAGCSSAFEAAAQKARCSIFSVANVRISQYYAKQSSEKIKTFNIF
jgi:hypothetical protein